MVSVITSLTVMTGNFVLSIILLASLNQLWTMLNGLQLTTHLPLFSLKFPSNAGFLLSFLISVATFDIMPIEGIWFFFDLPERGSHNSSFQASGYEFKYIVENMGTCFFMTQIYFLLCIVALICYFILRCTKGCLIEYVSSVHAKLKEILFWPVALRFVYESYLELVICVAIALLNLEWNSENFSIGYTTIFTIFMGLVIIALPCFTGIFYYCHLSKVE